MLKTAARARADKTSRAAARRRDHGRRDGRAAAQGRQDDVAERAKKVFPHLARSDALYANTGIETRYSCQP